MCPFMVRNLKVLLLGLVSTFSAYPEAVLTLVNNEIDMGSLTAEESKAGSVTIRNDGDTPLFILKVTSDCGCTVPTYPEDEIQPGDSAKITVRFTGKGREPGIFRKVVRIRSNAATPRSLLFIKGKIIRPIRK